jgi:hypothetical protein
MRKGGGYILCARNCDGHFTLMISLNLCNTIIQFIDTETETWKGLFICL